jgi:hypothetical protein
MKGIAYCPLFSFCPPSVSNVQAANFGLVISGFSHEV